LGVHPQTSYGWVREGRMPVSFRRLPSGTILVDVPTPTVDQRVFLSARVSSHDQRSDLDRQMFRLTSGQLGVAWRWVGWWARLVLAAMASARSWPGLSDPSASVIVVEHRDRLARFGVDHLQALAADGRGIVVVDDGETIDDLVRDMVEVLTSMCARLDGRRGARNRALRAVTATKHSESAGAG
jgi:putative resolvase